MKAAAPRLPPLPISRGEVAYALSSMASVAYASLAYPHAVPIWLMLLGLLLAPWAARSTWGRQRFRGWLGVAATALVGTAVVALAVGFQMVTMAADRAGVAVTANNAITPVGVSCLGVATLVALLCDFRFHHRASITTIVLLQVAGALLLGLYAQGAAVLAAGLALFVLQMGLLWFALSAAPRSATHKQEASRRASFRRVHGTSPTMGMLAACLVPAIMLALPTGWVVHRAKQAAEPFSSASADVMFQAKFDGKAPTDPYWRLVVDNSAPLNEFFWAREVNTNYDEGFRQQAFDWRGLPDAVPGEGAEVVTYRPPPGWGAIAALDGAFENQPGQQGSDLNKPVKAYTTATWQYSGNIPPDDRYYRIDFTLENDRLQRDHDQGEDQKLTNIASRSLASAREKMPKTWALVQQWKSEGLSGEALSARAQAWFATNLAYHFDHQSTDPERLRVDHFLFSERKGVCRHFANAFAMMMRMGGVPSRIVTGFHGGDFDPATNTWTVRERDGHAWTEIWLDGKGWTRVDPTSVVPVEKGIPPAVPDLFAWATRPFRLELPGGFSVADAVGAGDPSTWDNWALAMPQWMRSWRGLALAALAVIALVLAWRIFPRGARPVIHPNERAWHKVLAALARRGHILTPNMGPSSVGEQVAPRLPSALRPLLQEAAARYDRWRFGGASDDGLAGQLQELARALRRHRPSP